MRYVNAWEFPSTQQMRSYLDTVDMYLRDAAVIIKMFLC